IGGKVTTYKLSAGSHTLQWKPPASLTPGTYPVQVSAISYAGHRQTFTLAPLVVSWDTTPPQILSASYDGTTLSWQANDPGTPSPEPPASSARSSPGRSSRRGTRSSESTA